MPVKEVDWNERYEISEPLSEKDIDSLTANQNLKTIQTDRPLTDPSWDMLNGMLFSIRPDVEMRVYGRSGCWDLGFISRMPNVRRFCANCIKEADGVDALYALENLESLTIGIYNLDNFDFLTEIRPDSMRSLALERTRSKRRSLAPVARFRHLRELYLEGQTKHIGVISELGQLEELTLRSITCDGLDFIAGLENLWSLDIKLGGTTNLSALHEMHGIKYLELWQILGLRDISVISTMEGLQYLFLQSLARVDRIPDLSRLHNLRRVLLENMKSIHDYDPLLTAPNLEEFLYVGRKKLPEHIRRFRDELVGKTGKDGGPFEFREEGRNRRHVDTAPNGGDG
ncbi:hypothetical protein BH09SUM1_BH09SUM1_05610 [soil metagenome]